MKVVDMFNFLSNISVQDEMRWDPLGSNDQGNQSKNGFIHQTVVLV